MNKQIKVIRDTAERFRKQALICYDKKSSVVEIFNDSDSVFLQCDEACQFITKFEELCVKYPSLDEYTAACCLAEPYLTLLD
jgi:hypothetical protein